MLGRSRVLLVAFFMLLSPAAAAAWPMGGGDGGRTNGITEPVPTSNVALAWQASGQWSGIAVADDGSVVAAGDPMSVFEADGSTRWSSREITTPNGPRVFVAHSAPGLLSDGTIIAVGSYAIGVGGIVAFDAGDGTLKWLKGELGTGNCDDEHAAPAIGEDDSIYVGDCGGVRALEADGAERWTFDSQGETSIVAIDDARVYFDAGGYTSAEGTEYEHAIIALSRADGSIAWIHEATSVRVDPIVGNGHVYYSENTDVTALNAADGSLAWQTPVVRPFSLAITPDGRIVAGASNRVMVLAPSGTASDPVPTVGDYDVLASDTVILRSVNTKVTGNDMSGAPLWETPAGGTITSNVAVGPEGTIYYAEAGTLYAFDGEGGTTSTPPTTTPTTTPTSSPATTPTATSGGENGGGDVDGGDGGSDTPGFGVMIIALAGLGAALLTRRARR